LDDSFAKVGTNEGFPEGGDSSFVGCTDGNFDAVTDGLSVESVGEADGINVGEMDSCSEGETVGNEVDGLAVAVV